MPTLRTVLGLAQQRMIERRAAGGQIGDHLGDVLAVGPGIAGSLLRLDHAGRGDELHARA